MLIAIEKTGSTFSLLDHHDKKWLLEERERNTFYCPACGDRLILKLGEKKCYHFSHLKNAVCQSMSEPETPLHIQGKKDLFDWLKGLGTNPILEWYLPLIKQRADVGYMRFPNPIAFEFQCSSIPIDALNQRTKGYQSQIILPLWIWNEARLKRLGSNLYQLSSLELSTRRFPFSHEPLNLNQRKKAFLTFYNPLSKHFSFLYNLHPLSSRTYFGEHLSIRIDKTAIQDVLTPHLTLSPRLDWIPHWLEQKLKWRTQLTSKTNYFERHLAHLADRMGLVWRAFPGIVGCPLGDDGVIETASHLWQGWICLSFFVNKEAGHTVNKNEIENAFQALVNKKWIKIVNSEFDSNGWRRQIQAYLMGLCSMGYLKAQEQGAFVIRRVLKWPQPFIYDLQKEDRVVLKAWANQVKS